MTVKTKYGTLIVSKTFRVMIYVLDLVEAEVKPIFEKLVMEANCLIDVGAGYEEWYIIKRLRLNPKFKAITINQV